MKISGRDGQRGMALTIAIMLIICSSILAGYALQAGWNMRRLTMSMGSKRDKIYWYAKAGVVNARWRIRTNATAGLVNQGGGNNFVDDTYDPAPYQINLDGAGANDVEVDIWVVANGVRRIDSKGLDT